ncbi:23S rRNA (uracil-5-)-methyltransferase RumA [Saprolegnia diclina VS20]|uniref:23S rRNA (Uracil-5-)-methyltransferase RumA n=1 Tax=Saprolegnia diclina (strain VS20) TaxID=1156394 RepID=T0RNZ1_SAPDV|nr:23S rRNA (uracil-5-)-methyltransferase RumA [Saprolegnia diclina VS20]EQC34128.1 23S rRNA (uracil-5-)-methyltransferase RumA [Saprolegnia diclina VS20]|eukprot:XP_008612440.1 23S rRNA (uracil-5-)-methyltransferase RumA [Saprolegnia diclina VS20]
MLRRLSTDVRRKLKARQLVDVTIESLDIHGLGVGKDAATGLLCAVNGAIPGQHIKGRVLQDSVVPARVAQMELVAQSPDFVAPVCSVFDNCGGCKTQHYPYAKQVAAKQAAIQTTLGTSDVAPMARATSAFGYRNKMEFTYSAGRWLTLLDTVQDTHQATLGLFPKSKGARRWDGRVVAIDHCALQSDVGNRLVTTLWRVCRALPAYDYLKHTGFLRHLVVRVGSTLGGSTEVLLGLGTATIDDDTAPAVAAVVDALLATADNASNIVSVVQFMDDEMVRRFRKRHDGQRPRETHRVVHGRSFMKDTILHKEFRVSLQSFFQPNTAMASVLYAHVAGALQARSTPPVVWDLFCGVGSIGICVADHCAHVVGIDVVPDAIIDARANAEDNGVAEKMSFLCRDVLADGIPDGLPHPDVVIVDPPRAGLNAELISFLTSTVAPDEIIYVSCNVVSQARDLEKLLAAGYSASLIQPVDMLPHTPHVENIVVLRKA